LAAPESLKGFIENEKIFLSEDKQRPCGKVEIISSPNADPLKRPQEMLDGRWLDRKPEGAKQAAEHNEIMGQVPLRVGRGWFAQIKLPSWIFLQNT
jgi:hypothetical protein